MTGRNKLSLTSAAVAFGVAKETLRRALARAEIKTGDGATFTIRQCHNALAGDVRGERTRLLRAKADEQELKNKIRDGQLVKIATAERILWFNLYLPFKQALQAMPDEVSPLCVSPDAARAAIVAHVEKMKTQIHKPNQQDENKK